MHTSFQLTHFNKFFFSLGRYSSHFHCSFVVSRKHETAQRITCGKILNQSGGVGADITVSHNYSQAVPSHEGKDNYTTFFIIVLLLRLLSWIVTRCLHVLD